MNNPPLFRSTAILALFTALCAIALQACRAPLREVRRPNILLCLADDISYPHMGAYGTSWVVTPAFDRVAREGLLFANFYTPNAKCSPSRSCLLTGRNSWQLEEAANHWPAFPQKFKVYTEVLEENGYFVGYTGKGWGPGQAGEIEGRPRLLTGLPFNEKTTVPPAAHISLNDYAGNFEAFLKARPAGMPFCFWYGSTEPHRAYEFQAGIKQGGKKLSDIDRVPKFWPDNDTVRTDMLDYAFEIEYFDLHVQRMLDILDRRGELSNTLVIVTSDNGMPFPRVKAQTYEYSNHMPLAIMWHEGMGRPGRSVTDPVSMIDLAPTFLALAGIDARESGMQPMAGLSMEKLLTNGTSMPREYLLLGKERHDIGRPGDAGYPMRAILKDGFLYIRNYEPDRWPSGNPETGYLAADGSPTKTWILNDRRSRGQSDHWQMNFGRRAKEELYYIPDDPGCLQNLALSGDYASRIESMRSRMEAGLRKEGDPRMEGMGHLFDEYAYTDLRNKDFYARYMAGEEGMAAGWVEPGDFEPEPIEQ